MYFIKVIIKVDVSGAKVSSEQGSVRSEDGGDVNAP